MLRQDDLVPGDSFTGWLWMAWINMHALDWIFHSLFFSFTFYILQRQTAKNLKIFRPCSKGKVLVTVGPQNIHQPTDHLM